MKKISISIVEDDPLLSSQLKLWIEEHPSFQVDQVWSTGSDALEGLFHFTPHAIFMDIELPDMTGFDVVQEIPLDKRPHIIFTTIHREYALKAFEVTAMDYLVKPYSKERLNFTLERIIRELAEPSEQPLHSQMEELIKTIKAIQQDPAHELMPIRSGGKIYLLPLKQIEFIEASSYYIEIHYQGKKHLLRESLTTFGEQLDGRQFIRIHRSVIVNLHYIQEVEKINQNDYQVRLRNQKSFRISKTYLKPLFDILQIK